jgi:hypothetical protein
MLKTLEYLSYILIEILQARAMCHFSQNLQVLQKFLFYQTCPAPLTGFVQPPIKITHLFQDPLNWFKFFILY